MSKFPDRYDRIREAMKADQLDALLVMSPNGTCYLSGTYIMTQVAIPERHAYVLLPQDGEPSFLVCNIEEHQAREHGTIDDLYTYVEFEEEPAEAAVRMLRERGIEKGRIGIEAQTIPAESVHILHQALPHIEWVHWDTAFRDLQVIKDDYEVAALETAGNVLLDAINDAFRNAEPGCTERAVAREIFNSMIDGGLMPMFNVFVSGNRTLLSHGEPIGRVMEPGDIVRLDVVGRHENNYLADMARTGVVGDPSSEQKSIFRKIYCAQQAAFDAIKPGLPVSTLFHAVVEQFARDGIDFRNPHIGHGMGIGLHESPMIHPGNDTPLQPGMVLNIEPAITFPDRQEGYHVEDLIVITDDGFRFLTQPQEALLAIE